MSEKYRFYFRDEVRYPEIQRPGPLALLAEAEGAELDALWESGQKVRDQFFPALAEIEGVAEIGRARGVRRHALEDDGQYRLRVKKAWAWQWLAGRHWGLHKIFAEYGFPVIKLTNLTGDHWAEFDIEVESPPGKGFAEAVDLVYWLVFEYKRASAMLRTLRATKKITARPLRIAAAAAVGEHIIFLPEPHDFHAAQTPVRIKAAVVIHERWIVKGVRHERRNQEVLSAASYRQDSRRAKRGFAKRNY